MSESGKSSSSSDFSDSHPSTTTISTVAVQAGSARVVLAILRVSVGRREKGKQMEGKGKEWEEEKTKHGKMAGYPIHCISYI